MQQLVTGAVDALLILFSLAFVVWLPILMFTSIWKALFGRDEK